MADLVSESRLPRRMSRDDYRALPEGVRAEWVDGQVMVTPSPSYRHQQAARRVANLLELALPDLFVVEAVTVSLLAERIPDVVVVTTEPAENVITEVPVIAVEVISPRNRSEDTVRKSTEYLAAGVGQYWLVDPVQRTLDVFENATAGWQTLANLDDENPTAAVQVTGHGRVDVDLAELLRR